MDEKIIEDYSLYYCYLNAGYHEDSVQRKIRNQILALDVNGIRTKGVFFYFETNKVEKPIAVDKSFIFVSKGPEPTGYFRSLKAKRASVLAFKKWMKINKASIPFIYLRYDGASYLLYRFCKKYGSVIGLEFQSKNINEIRNNASYNPFGLRPSKLLSWIEHQFIPLSNEEIFGRLIAGKVNFILGVTREIAEWNQKRSLFRKPPIFSLGNGVSAEGVSPHSGVNFDGKTIKFMILIGAAKGATWNGIERILKSMKQYKGEYKLELHVAGITDELEGVKEPFIVQHGFLSGGALEQLVENCHIAFGAFAMDKIQLTEGSTMKMREYAARGIPCVYGHEDADYIPLVNMGLAYRVKTPEAFAFQDVVQFAVKAMSIPNYADKIRDYAVNHLDFKVKMKVLKEIIEKQKQKALV
ncbi:MAG: hypothetical protein KG003_00255 [Bacteroidetes bacterium]|nr:hypothetical protein [Bacteroidota bacterium]